MTGIRISLFFITLIFFGACSKPMPLENYSDDQLIEILFDVHVANNMVNANSKEIRDSLKRVYFEQLQEIHDLSASQLDSIIDLVHLDNKRHIRIYDSLSIKVQAMIDSETIKEESNNRNK